MGQDHLGTASRFALADFDIELLWDAALRTALRINGRAAEIEDEATRSGSHSEDDSTPTVPAESEPPPQDPDDHFYHRKFGRDLTQPEKKAIEMWAVEVTRQHFENELGYSTEDVGDKRSYDIHATNGDQTIVIEVKGTITDGSTVAVTAAEVILQEAEYPNNAFAVVRNIVLDSNVDPPVAGGGELVTEMPWKIDRARLTPTSTTISPGTDPGSNTGTVKRRTPMSHRTAEGLGKGRRDPSVREC